MHSGVDLVVLDSLNEKGRNPEQVFEVLKRIKASFPETEVIVHTTNDDLAIAVGALRSGATDYIIKHNNSWLRIGMLADKIVAQPIRALFTEWGVKKFIGIFFFFYNGSSRFHSIEYDFWTLIQKLRFFY